MASNAEEIRLINELLARSVGLSKQQKEYYLDIAKGINEGKKASEKFSNLQKDILRSVKETSLAVYDVKDAFAASVDELKGLNSGLNRTKKAFQGLESISSKLVEDASGRNRLSLKQLKNIKNEVNQKLEDLKVSKELNQSNLEENTSRLAQLSKIKKLNSNEKKEKKTLLEQNKKITHSLFATNNELSETENLNKDLIRQANIRINQEEDINKRLGATPAILEGIGKSLQKLGLPDFGISDSIKGAKEILRVKSDELALEGKKLTTSQSLSTVTGQVFKGIRKSVSVSNLLQGAFGFLVSSMLQLDKLTGTLAKNIGVSYKDSLAMQKNFNQIAISSEEIMVSTAEVNKSFSFLNKQFGGTTKFSDELLHTFTALTAQAGFTEESIGTLTVLTKSEGKELQNNLSLMQGELLVMNKHNKTSFSTKQLTEDIGKVSKATLLTLRDQPKALSNTLYTSKKLALSFAEMESISSSLLNFESSIQNELEAELLTGKNLNLEKARLYALEGNIGKAAAEVAKQVGSAAEFGAMNVIQQEALAKAAGLTREQLAKSLMEREALIKLGKEDGNLQEEYNKLKYEQGKTDKEIADILGNDVLQGQLKSNAIQAKFSASVERLKEVFIEVGSALMPIVSSIANMVVGISKFVAKFGFLIKYALIAKGIFKGIQATMTIMKFLSNGVYRNQVLTNIASKRGLITDQQVNVQKRISSIYDKGMISDKGIKNMLDEKGLFTKLRENAQLKLSNIFGKEGIIQEKMRGLFKKGNLLTSVASNTAEKTSNALSAVGNKIEKKGLFAKIGGAIMSAMEAVTSGVGALLGPFAIPLALAAGAAIGAIGYSFMKDGVIGPGGETVVSGPKGSIQLDKEDSMIVGTDLGGTKTNNKIQNTEDKNNKTTTTGVNTQKTLNIKENINGENSQKIINLLQKTLNIKENINGENSQKIINLLQTQNEFLKAIASKSTTIKMSGNVVGQGINASERETQ